ncbi:MAG: hypothetical protein OHK0046_50630 [Anaerolineae bacterium]
MSAITVGGDLVHYEVLGRGRPVILLHGWLGSWRYWIPTMRLLQLKYRVYALDFFGYGDSGKNPAKYPPEQQIILLDEFMKQLGIPKAAFIGHGLGAHITIEFARRNVERVARMLLVSAPLFPPDNLANRVPPNKQVLLTPPPMAQQAAETIASRPPELSAQAGASDATIPSAANRTMGPNAIDRDALRKAAAEAALARGEAAMRGETVTAPLNRARELGVGSNPLRDVLSVGLDALVLRCFRKSDSDYKTLEPDLIKMDNQVLVHTSMNYDAGVVLDALRVLPTPTLLAHGMGDPIIPPPSDAVLNYISEDEGRHFAYYPLDEAKHFPMLDHEPFMRLVTAFLETDDLNSIELKNRWKRRTR